MTTRLLLSLFLDFFRCRKPFWRRATINVPDVGDSTWSLGQIMDVPREMSQKVKQEAVAISSDSDYDSVGNSMDISEDNKDAHVIDIKNANEKTNKPEYDNDNDDGFDDPRLPEMII
ncbi:uncharacterized protein LOC133848954 [Drosophila sulfurigaster albostrigata]|uniref:uncharacterized protein LOC133848954 n=1 Tax=Drosophila sulfurigaster albostrigata TaxID=89887 RepID=UPI002D21BC56|nr:uncharacterized protein LOC133848954 [Drosophila sulfurigaster albostrigata]